MGAQGVKITDADKRFRPSFQLRFRFAGCRRDLRSPHGKWKATAAATYLSYQIGAPLLYKGVSDIVDREDLEDREN